MVNAVSMDNVEHAYAVQQLRKSGKIAKIVSVIFSDSAVQMLPVCLITNRNSDVGEEVIDSCEVTRCQADFSSLLRSDNQTEEEGARPHGPAGREGDDVGARRGGGQLRRGDLRDAEWTQRRLQRGGRGYGPAQRAERRATGQGTRAERLAREEPLPTLRPPLAQSPPAPRQGHAGQISQK